MLDKTGYAAPPTRRSPLGHRDTIQAGDGRARLSERPMIGKLIIRGAADDIGPALESQAGIALPADACTSAESQDGTLLWLGPSEWMLHCGEGDERVMMATIETALTGIHHQVVDVTDYYTIIRVSGPASRDMLQKVTTLDLHPRSFPAGAIKGSIFGRVPSVLHRPANEGSDEDPVFDLIIRGSHADYLWCLIAWAGREYGLPEQTPEGRVKLAVSPH